LGPDIELEAVEAVAVAAQSAGVHVERCSDDAAFAARVAEKLAAGKVVGLAYGRMEFGPRALGHRSILAPATDRSINDSLNERLKRTEFMPFAPVTLRSLASSCFKGWEPEHVSSRFMTMCYDTTEEFGKQCPAVVHVDGTARPQVVDEKDGLYERVVRAYLERTGLMALVNTSFNAHGEPIVCNAEDAWRGFHQQDCCDVLALHPLIFTKDTAVEDIPVQ